MQQTEQHTKVTTGAGSETQQRLLSENRVSHQAQNTAALSQGTLTVKGQNRSWNQSSLV